MKKQSLITFSSIFLICIGLFSTLLLDESLGSRIAEVITLITAVVGAVALFLQFRRDKDINEASFLLEFWNNFTETPDLIDIQKKCDDDIRRKTSSFTKDDYKGILTYAQWLEALSTTINRDILAFNFIDDMFNYMFFVFVNNKYVQKVEILPNIQFYNGILTAYKSWTKYLKKHNKSILLEENALDKAVEEYLNKTNKK
ncbi:MAG: hypothetical protein E7374_00230 [Clostridiales bacterium]|nr:hypothetical protein [Clostridiales bacterium]